MKNTQIRWANKNALYLDAEVRKHLGIQSGGDFQIRIFPNNNGTVTLEKYDPRRRN